MTFDDHEACDEEIAELQSQLAAVKERAMRLARRLDAEQEKNRWRLTEDITDEEMDWDLEVEALEEGDKVPRIMTMAEIFLDEGSEIKWWRPTTLPGE